MKTLPMQKGAQDGAKVEYVKVGASVNVGQYPEGHAEEGKWAVQVMISPFANEQQANHIADQVLPIIEGLLGARGKGVKMQ